MAGRVLKVLACFVALFFLAVFLMGFVGGLTGLIEPVFDWFQYELYAAVAIASIGTYLLFLPSRRHASRQTEAGK